MSKLIIGQNDFETWCRHNNRLDLLLEWDYSFNDNLKPCNISFGTAREIGWICSKGHKWLMSLNKRTGNDYGCPICSGRRVVSGVNDFATEYPVLLKEWHPTKNTIQPNEVRSGSKRKVWWICGQGHEWPATLSDRTLRHSGCPICSKELKTSFPEQALFFYVNRYFSDAISGDMHIGIELDIYIPSKKTALEFDGLFWHKNKEKKDLKKNIICAEHNIRIIRIRERGLPHIEQCVEFEVDPGASNAKLSDAYHDVLSYLGIVDPYVDVENEQVDILTSYVTVKKAGSLAAKFPEIAKEWHPVKNRSISPDNISYGSMKKVWWLGKCGHEFRTSPNSRVSSNTNCPICSGRKVLLGFNDLRSQNPRLAEEWEYSLNGELKPEQFTLHSSRKVWWKCNKGHKWPAQISSRSDGQGCPICSNHKLLVGFNDLQTKFPDVATEWHPYKNGNLKPADCLFGSMKKVWWKCSECGGEWETTISKRTFRGDKCPYCPKHGFTKVLTGVNDLETQRPDLALEWDYDKNEHLKPYDVTLGSKKKVWWKCNCGHEWQASICDRTLNSSNCPICSNKKLLIGFNDLQTKFPDIAKEWDYEKNANLKPTDVVSGSHKKVWWICQKGHSYPSSIVHRTARRQGCPYCSGRSHPRIMCIETGKVYEYGMNAYKETGIDVSSINQCCKGKRKTAGGFHWKYVED